MRTDRHVRIAGLGLLLLAACQDPLLVENENQADRDRALSTPGDVESFLGGSYQAVHAGTLGSTAGIYPQLLTSAMESYSALANFNMGPRGAVPRGPLSNQRGNPAENANFRDFLFQHRAARIASIVLGVLKSGDFTLGSPARNARATAFARFVQGVGLGNIALAYDSGSVLTENDDPDAINPLVSYSALMQAALGYLDSAIAIASGPVPTGTGWFPLPSTWINGLTLSASDFVRLARSYKARFRAGVARTPAERALVNWVEVIGDAVNGITADFRPTMTPAAGWDIAWPTILYNTGSANWHQMSQFFLGMADTSGEYSAWLADPPASREPFLVVSPDRRIPRGADRATQQANSPAPNAGFPFDSVPYFRNRPTGEDQPGAPIGKSFYDFYRPRRFFDAARIGTYPVMTKAEMDLLAAEGYLRTGNVAAAVALINVSRVAKGGLPALALTDTVSLIPGNACVPRVPDPATNFKSARCGTVWDALKWEYRLENAYIAYGAWFFAARGWGDLPEGTAVHWPVPFQEMDARQQAFYDMGGVGAPGGAARGNYGLFAGGVY